MVLHVRLVYAPDHCCGVVIVLRGGVKARNGAAQVTVLASLLGLLGDSPPRDFTDVIGPGRVATRTTRLIPTATSFERSGLRVGSRM